MWYFKFLEHVFRTPKVYIVSWASLAVGCKPRNTGSQLTATSYCIFSPLLNFAASE